MEDRLNGRHRSACFASLLNDAEEWHRSCIDGAQLPMVQSSQMLRFGDSLGISACEILLVLHSSYVYYRACLRQKEGRNDTVEPLRVPLAYCESNNAHTKTATVY